MVVVVEGPCQGDVDDPSPYPVGEIDGRHHVLTDARAVDEDVEPAVVGDDCVEAGIGRPAARSVRPAGLDLPSIRGERGCGLPPLLLLATMFEPATRGAYQGSGTPPATRVPRSPGLRPQAADPAPSSWSISSAAERPKAGPTCAYVPIVRLI